MVNSWCFSPLPSDSRCYKHDYMKHCYVEMRAYYYSHLKFYLLFSSDNSTEVSSSDNKTTWNQRTLQVNTQYSVSVFYSLFSKKLSCNVVALCKLIKFTFLIIIWLDIVQISLLWNWYQREQRLLSLCVLWKRFDQVTKHLTWFSAFFFFF